MDRPVTVLGVPMDLGADRRGVDMGPSAIRYAGLADQLESIGVSCVDGGDVRVPRPEERDPDASDDHVDGHAKYLAEVETVCERIRADVAGAIEDGTLPLALGGDHSIAIGTVAGAERARSGEDLGVLWFDAHGDFNLPTTTPSGNVHGMPVAAILGLGPFGAFDWTPDGIEEDNVALVGLRNLDEREKELVRDSDVATYTMTDIDERGISEVLEEAMGVVTGGTDAIHVSLDMDWLDPDAAPGVGTPVRGGVTYREAHTAMEYVGRRVDDVCSLEVVEVNPILDQHNRTAELAVELAASALGKRIL